MRRLLPALFAVLALLAACTGAPSPTPASTPTPGPPQTTAALKLALVDRLGKLWFCDPDVYPIQRQDEIASALERWPEVQADGEAFAAILADLGVAAGPDVPDAQKLAVYQAWKVLNAIALEPAGADSYRFDYLAEPVAGAQEGTRSTGTITSRGVITIDQQAAAGEPICPICLARGTRIETPAGGIAVDAIRIGDIVWTRDAAGRRVAATVLATGSTAAPAGHRVVRLLLVDGRTLTASPGHPLADGRRLGDLRPGDLVDGSAVQAADLLPYAGDATFDLVVSGGTGAYFVDGIALGSTID